MAHLARQVDPAGAGARVAAEVPHAQAAEVEREARREFAQGGVVGVARVERVFVDVLVHPVGEVGPARVDERLATREDVRVRRDHRGGGAVDGRDAVRVVAEEGVEVLPLVALHQARHGEAVAAPEARGELGLAGRLLAPVHRPVRRIAERGHVHRPPVHRHRHALVGGGVDGLHDALPVEKAVVADKAAGREERQALADAGHRARERALRFVGARQARRLRKQARRAGRVAAAVGLEAALVAVAAVLRHDVDDAGLRLPVLGVERPGDDLHLLDRVVLHLEGVALVEHVVHRHAVDEVRHLAHAPAAKVPLHDARLEVHHVLKRLHRQRAQLLGRNRSGGRGRGRAARAGGRR